MQTEAIPPNMTESRRHKVSISVFVDADLAGDKSTRRIQIGVLISINKAPIHWYINIKEYFEAITYGVEFCDMKSCVEVVEALYYKLRMFGVLIYGSTNVFCDDKVVYNNTITPESVLKRKHHSISYHRFR